MERKVVLAALALALVLALAGCGVKNPFKWQPTEPQKRAADLSARNWVVVKPHVQPAGEPIREEGEAAAELTQTYMGLPKERAVSQAPGNPFMFAEAQVDAARPPPALPTVIRQTIDDVEEGAQVGLALVTAALTAAGSIAATWGLGKYAGGIKKIKDRAKQAEGQVTLTAEALREVVGGIQGLDDATKAKVKAGQKQSAATAKLVAAAKAENGQ